MNPRRRPRPVQKALLRDVMVLARKEVKVEDYENEDDFVVFVFVVVVVIFD